MLKRNSIYTFIKAQLSAFLGGVVDYVTMVSCTELLHIHYTGSIVIGGTVGALVNFTINRNWTFEAYNNQAKNKTNWQLIKFASMVGGSIVLKSSGTYWLTEWGKMDYRISRILVDIVVSLGFNYSLQRYWIFKKNV